MKKSLTTKDYRLKTQRGFTLVEVMIAVGLFVTVMLIGVGAVLNTNVTHKRTLAVRQVLDSVNFLVEDMARNIRLGQNYNCIVSEFTDYTPQSLGVVVNNASISEPEDCLDGLSIAFEPMNGDTSDEADQMAYIIEGSGDTASIKKISFLNGIGTVIRDITPGLGQSETNLVIDPRQSGFTVIGSLPYPPDVSSDPVNYDMVQPRVIIRLSGYIDYKQNRVPFSVQTTVTQRLIDS